MRDISRAAEIVHRSDALLVTAGAGMGVDSGHPTYRGPEKLRDPGYERLGLTYNTLASAKLFREKPEVAWGFYAQRIVDYFRGAPHSGYAVLLAWNHRMRERGFVFTSNVDSYFVRAGFERERVVEVHGSLDKLQCTRWWADGRRSGVWRRYDDPDGSQAHGACERDVRRRTCRSNQSARIDAAR